jgi:enamine deaminase RidA (YjgF/YER057c/UK114 family)
VTNEGIDIGVATRIAEYSDAVVVQGDPRWFHLSGTPGFDGDGVLPPDFGAQAENCWANVRAALDKAGFDIADLVKVTTWVTDASFIAESRKARVDALGDVRPALMLAVVDALAWPEIKIEVEVIAARAA